MADGTLTGRETFEQWVPDLLTKEGGGCIVLAGRV